jgi:hypothetical protein
VCACACVCVRVRACVRVCVIAAYSTLRAWCLPLHLVGRAVFKAIWLIPGCLTCLCAYMRCSMNIDKGDGKSDWEVRICQYPVLKNTTCFITTDPHLAPALNQPTFSP